VQALLGGIVTEGDRMAERRTGPGTGGEDEVVERKLVATVAADDPIVGTHLGDPVADERGVEVAGDVGELVLVRMAEVDGSATFIGR
jgi:hypothetical protein